MKEDAVKRIQSEVTMLWELYYSPTATEKEKQKIRERLGGMCVVLNAIGYEIQSDSTVVRFSKKGENYGTGHVSV